MAVLQDGDRLLIVPIVNDPFEDDRVSPRGQGLKEIAPDQLTTVRDVWSGDLFFGAGDDLRRVEQDAGHSGIFLQDRSNQTAVSAACVHDFVDAAETVNSVRSALAADGNKTRIAQIQINKIEEIFFIILLLLTK